MLRLIPLAALAALLLGTPILRAEDHAKKDEKPMRLTDADNKKTVQVPAGTPFDIAIKGNATTGFQWKIDKIEGDGVQQTGKVDYVPNKHAPGMIGYGGTFIFHFNTMKTGQTKIRLVYVRPWEKDKPPEKTFKVTIESSPRP